MIMEQKKPKTTTGKKQKRWNGIHCLTPINRGTLDQIALALRPEYETMLCNIKNEIDAENRKSYTEETISKYKGVREVDIKRRLREITEQYEEVLFYDNIVKKYKEIVANNETTFGIAYDMSRFVMYAIPSKGLGSIIEIAYNYVESVSTLLVATDLFREGKSIGEVKSILRLSDDAGRFFADEAAKQGITIARTYNGVNRKKSPSKLFSYERCVKIDELLRTGMHYKEVSYRLGIRPLQKTSGRRRELIESGEELPEMLQISFEVADAIAEIERAANPSEPKTRKSERLKQLNEKLRSESCDDDELDDDMDFAGAQYEEVRARICILINTTDMSDLEIANSIGGINDFASEFVDEKFVYYIRRGRESGSCPATYEYDADTHSIVYLYRPDKFSNIRRHKNAINDLVLDILVSPDGESINRKIEESDLCRLNEYIIDGTIRAPYKNQYLRFVSVSKKLKEVLLGEAAALKCDKEQAMVE